MPELSRAAQGYLEDMSRQPGARQPATVGEIWDSEWKRGGLDTITGVGKPLIDATDELRTAIATASGKPLEDYAAEKRIPLGAGATLDQRIKALGDLADTLPEEAKKTVDPLRDVRRRAAQNAQKIERDAAEVSASTYGVAGTATAWAAGIARQSTDLPNIAMMLATAPLGGPVTGSAVKFIAGQAAGGAISQAAVEPYIETSRAELGLESGFGRAATNIFEAGVGGAVIGGAGVGVHRLFRAAADSYRGFRPAEATIRPGAGTPLSESASPVAGLPPVAEGDVRLYRGENKFNEPNGSYYSTDKEMASAFGELRYVDVPKDTAKFFKMPGMGEIYNLPGYGAGPGGVEWRSRSALVEQHPNLTPEDFDALALHAERDAAMHAEVPAGMDPIAHAEGVHQAARALEDGRPFSGTEAAAGFTPSQLRPLLDAETEQIINMWHEAKTPLSPDASDHFKSVMAAYARELDRVGVWQARTENEVRDILFEKRGDRVKPTKSETVDAQPELPLAKPIEPKGPPAELKQPVEVIGDPVLAQDVERRIAQHGDDLQVHIEQPDKSIKAGSAKSFLKEIADDAKAVKELIDCIGQEPK